MADDDDFVDLYDLLGVEAEATKAQLRKAYHTKSRALHPDKNPDPRAGELFDAVKKAYDTLTDPGKKAEFDTRRAAVLHQALRFKEMDAEKQRVKTTLEERERAAAERAHKVATRTKARALAEYKAAYSAFVEDMVKEEVDKRRAAASARDMGNVAAGHRAAAAAAAAPEQEDDPVGSLAAKEAAAWAAMGVVGS